MKFLINSHSADLKKPIFSVMSMHLSPYPPSIFNLFDTYIGNKRQELEEDVKVSIDAAKTQLVDIVVQGQGIEAIEAGATLLGDVISTKFHDALNN